MSNSPTSGSLSSLLTKCRVKSGTGTSNYASRDPPGSYYISPSYVGRFMDAYCNAVANLQQHSGTVVSLSYVEKPNRFAPLRVDCDFRSYELPGEDANHVYTPDEVKHIINLYQKFIRTVTIDTRPEQSYCILMEKKKYRIETDNNGETYYKDGFHLHFPHFICEDWIMEYIRSKVIKSISTSGFWTDETFTEPLKKVFDDLRGKWWYLYGSAASRTKEPYRVTICYDENGKQISLRNTFPNANCDIEHRLPALLSVQGHESGVIIDPNLTAQIKHLLTRSKAKIKRKQVRTKTDEEVAENLAIIRENGLMDMLSRERAEDYSMWMEVGWTLFGIGDGSQEALNMWIDFSRIATDKFEEGVCEKKWDTMKPNGRTIASLMFMAKQDDPEQYEEMKQTNIFYLISQSLHDFIGRSPSEVNVAKVVLHMYRNRYICAGDTRKNEWYEYDRHRWRKCSEANSLRMQIVEDVRSEYYNYREHLCRQQRNADDERRAKLEEQIKRTGAVIANLLTVRFHDKLIKACKPYMNESQFYDKIDMNRNLFACENGVLMLDQHLFRPGNPEDYLTKTCGYDFINYTPNHPDIETIENLLRTIFPNENRRRYFLDICTMMLGGKNTHKKFVIFTGHGNNGKSVLFDLIHHTFGEYAGKFPRDLLVGRQNTSSAARPELARTKGRRVMTTQEIAVNEKINIGVLKELTGNDAFYARTLFEEGGEIIPMFTMLLQCNELPNLPSGDPASWNRIRVLLCESTFDDNPPEDVDDQILQNHYQSDPELGQRIPDLAPAFLWMLFNRYPEFSKNKLVEPKEVMADTEQYHSESNSYYLYCKECIEDAPKTEYISASQVLSEYRGWFKENYPGARDLFNIMTIKREMSRFLGPLEKNTRWYGKRFSREENESEDLFSVKQPVEPPNNYPVKPRKGMINTSERGSGKPGVVKR